MTLDDPDRILGVVPGQVGSERTDGDEVAFAPGAEPAGHSYSPCLGVRTAYGLTMSFVVLNVLAALGAGAFAAAGGSKATVTFLLFGLLLAVYVITLVIVWKVASSRGPGFSRTVGLAPVGVEAIAHGAVVAIGLRFAAGLWAWFVQVLGLDLQGADIDPSRLLPAGPVGDVLTAFLIVIAAPFVEEVVFRGVLQTSLACRYSTAMAVSVSALLFTVVHFNAFASVPILLAGVAFGLLAVRWDSLWPAITAHAVFNAVGLAFLFAARYLGLS